MGLLMLLLQWQLEFGGLEWPMKLSSFDLNSILSKYLGFLLVKLLFYCTPYLFLSIGLTVEHKHYHKFTADNWK